MTVGQPVPDPPAPAEGDLTPESEWLAALDALDRTLTSLRESLDSASVFPEIAPLAEPTGALPAELAKRAREVLAETRALEEQVMDAMVTIKNEFIGSRRDAAGLDPARPHFIDRRV